MASGAATSPLDCQSMHQKRGAVARHRGKDESSRAKSDPAEALLGDWQRAQHVSLVLSRLQQRLEMRIIKAVGFRGQVPTEAQLSNEELRKVRKHSDQNWLCRAGGMTGGNHAEVEGEIQKRIARWDAVDEEVGYSVAQEAEVMAMTAALKLQDAVPNTAARSLLGIVAKLEIIMGADRDIDDPTDFPWPHIASVLGDLKQLAGGAPSERPDRSVVRVEVARYWASAANQVRQEKVSRRHR